MKAFLEGAIGETINILLSRKTSFFLFQVLSDTLATPLIQPGTLTLLLDLNSLSIKHQMNRSS